MVASGYFDLATHPLAAQRLLEQAGADAGRVEFISYPAGHMLYVGETAAAFANDVRMFIVGPTNTPTSGR
jgi:hypothetical protein